MTHHIELVRREHAIFQAEEDGRITLHDMLRQLLNLWYHYQQLLEKQP